MLDIQKLKFKDVGFIINGVEFQNKESATDFLIVHFSKKIIEILTIYNKMCKVKESMIESDVASVNLNVQIKEKLLMPEWYANKPLFTFFSKEILEKLNIEYKADEGGKNTITVDGPAPNSFTISLNRDTGILSGKIRVYSYKEGQSSRPKLSNGKTYVEATWTGVMTTGWGADCGCLEDDSLTLPFICGALSFTDEIPYLKADGTTKTVKQLSGGEIYSGARTVE